MIKHHIHIKIRYAETDQMGYVHHSQYALYLEEARMELLKSIGFDCIAMEKNGVIMPVVEMETRFSFPLFFGDTIEVETTIHPPWDTRLEFRYRIRNQHKKLVSRAKISLVLAEKETGKILKNPDKYLDCLNRSHVGITP
ncbi:MAG: acyl-CoA thioesterase [Bacteroidota bacterium]